jgi:hypothetical protein
MGIGIKRWQTTTLIIILTLALPAGIVQAGQGQGAAKQDKGSLEQRLLLHLQDAAGEHLQTLDLSFADHAASRADLHFGSKVPIATTTFNFTQTDSNGTAIPVTSYTYQNLGFEVSANPFPQVTTDGLVAFSFKYELSYLAEPAGGEAGGSPSISSREARRVLALTAGESLVVAEFHQTREIEELARVLGLDLRRADLDKRPWKLVLERQP